ncbi:transposase-like zinc-binding domain-containing protein [Campylobacter sp.]
MFCPSNGPSSKNCGSFFIKKCGFTKSKIQRFSCKDCYKNLL